MKTTSRAKKAAKILLWSAIGIGSLSAIGGAIYFVIKNSRPQKKDYYSPEEFTKEAKAIGERLRANLETSQSAQTIHNSFVQSKNQSEADTAVEDSDSQNQEKPKFSAHDFISRHINNELTFQQEKNFIVEYTNLRVVENKPHQLVVEYNVKLNYENATGRQESEKIQGTDKSLYYYRGEKIVEFLNKDSDLENNNLFKENVEKALSELHKILRKHLENKDDGGMSTPDQSNSEADKWFNSKEFREEVFKWFKDIFEKSDAYPLAFRENNDPKGAKKYDLIPYDSDDSPSVNWNPKKGLNILSINYQFQSLSDPDPDEPSPIKTDPYKWLYNVEGI